MSEPLGVVLAGGLSRRMEGAEKSLMMLSGKTLISRVCSRLAEQVPSLIINANGDPKRFSALKLQIVPDTVDGFAGPLAGVLAGMRWAKDNGVYSHILTAAADTPFFPLGYTEKMTHQLRKDNSKIALAMSNDRRHPVFGLWDTSLADELEAFLIEEEERKVMLFVRRYANTTVAFEAGQIDPFFNVNTPADMKMAEHIVSEIRV